MSNEMNPFFVKGKIPAEYFCDREKESSDIAKLIRNGNNIVFIAPRRMGKTALINFCYETMGLEEQYNTFFIDILHTTSTEEFTLELGREVFKKTRSKGRDALEKLVQVLKSLNGKFGFDQSTLLPNFSISIGDLAHPEYTLEEIFTFLDSLDKKSIIAIDEFQQISKYPKGNFEALLRSYIQRTSKISFIFAGSEKHMMQRMFLDSNHPFYNSATLIGLNPIPMEKYTSWAKGIFEQENRSINIDDLREIYSSYEGHTFYMQRILNECFSNTEIWEDCTKDVIRRSTDDVLDYYNKDFEYILQELPLKTKQTLYAIASEGKATRITGEKFIKRHALESASAVQYATRTLLDKNIIVRDGNTYSLENKFLSKWIRRKMKS